MHIYYTYDRRPGDYLRQDDDEIPGFKARLNERLAPVGTQFSGEGVNEDWNVGDALAQWWRPNFETFMYPFLPGHVTRPKECKKLYFIQLPKKSVLPPSLLPFAHLCGFTRNVVCLLGVFEQANVVLCGILFRSALCSEKHEAPSRPSLRTLR